MESSQMLKLPEKHTQIGCLITGDSLNFITPLSVFAAKSAFNLVFYSIICFHPCLYLHLLPYIVWGLWVRHL